MILLYYHHYDYHHSDDNHSDDNNDDYHRHLHYSFLTGHNNDDKCDNKRNAKKRKASQ